MGLGVKYHEGSACPIIICDSCGKQIEDWKLAMVSCEMAADNEASCSACIYHKESCDPGMPLRYELSTYISFLLWNNNWGRRHRRQEDDEIVNEIIVEMPEF